MLLGGPLGTGMVNRSGVSPVGSIGLEDHRSCEKLHVRESKGDKQRKNPRRLPQVSSFTPLCSFQSHLSIFKS